MAKKGKKWYAVYTKYKCEKYVRDQVLSKEMEAYVPLIEEIKKYKTKTRKVQKPLISSFVFVNIDIKNYVKVLEIQYVRGFLKIAKEMIPIPEEEIDVLRMIVGEKVEKQENIDLSLGSNVEIVSGNMTGIKGTIIDIKGKKSFVVALDTLGVQFQIEVNPKLLKLKK